MAVFGYFSIVWPGVGVDQMATIKPAIDLLAEGHENGVAEPDELTAAQVVEKRNASIEHRNYSYARVLRRVSHELHEAL
jgi:hypothetical protein